MLNNAVCYDNMLHMAVKVEQNLYTYIEDVLHDVKTPTSVIFSALQSMDSLCRAASCGNTDIVRLNDIARRECYNVMRLLRDIADIGKLVNEKSPALSLHNLVSLVERVCESSAIVAKQRNIDINFDTNNEEIYIECNREYAERLFYNIMSNAVKHSPDDSGIEVKVIQMGEFARVYVSDEGEGVNSASTALFERYVTNNGQLGSGSSGIGLAIVREIAEMFGWNVKLKNRIGKAGAVCVIKVPVSSYENVRLDMHLDNLFADETKPVWDLAAWLM